MRANISRHRWARIAWLHISSAAAAALSASPQPATSNRNYASPGTGSCGDGDDGWQDCLYGPGLIDGHRVRNLALAYAVTGDRRYALKAKEFLLAWARSYNPLPAPPGHNVAEPVGFMIKGFMAYDLVQDVFAPAERRQFKAWAAMFVERAKRLADAARDRPWIPEAPYGNGAAWPRALAVLAAGVVGGKVLESTLAWNWQHTTPGGQDYGWLDLIEGAVAPDGQMTEERIRQSITYGLYTWLPLALIADVATHAGFARNLWTAKTASGKSMYLPVVFYAPYLVKTKVTPYPGERDSQYDAWLAEYRTVMELARKAYPQSKTVRKVVSFGGDVIRGSDYDLHITGWNALTGR
jgi:hypothetical protein